MNYKRILSRISIIIGSFVIILCFSNVFAAEINSSNITQAPYNCPTSATICYLTSDGITSIASGTFINHTNLQNLLLYGNQITSIEKGDFAGLTNLQYLRINTNKISTIESGAFIGLNSLIILDIDQNQLTGIENGYFSGLPAVMNIVLNENQITSIESGDFTSLPSLLGIGLMNNKITSIESGAFNSLPSINDILIAGNCLSPSDLDVVTLQLVKNGSMGSFPSQNPVCSSFSQGEINLSILSGNSYCLYGTAIDLGSQTLGTGFGALIFSGSFLTESGTNNWSCTDFAGSPSGWDLTIQSTDLTNEKNNVITADNVKISHNSPILVGGACVPGGTGSIDDMINYPHTILAKQANTQRSICKIQTNNVKLKVDVPAYQTPGTYVGTLTITLPTFN